MSAVYDRLHIPSSQMDFSFLISGKKTKRPSESARKAKLEQLPNSSSPEGSSTLEQTHSSYRSTDQVQFIYTQRLSNPTRHTLLQICISEIHGSRHIKPTVKERDPKKKWSSFRLKCDHFFVCDKDLTPENWSFRCVRQVRGRSVTWRVELKCGYTASLLVFFISF